jgi:hypothetical protein
LLCQLSLNAEEQVVCRFSQRNGVHVSNEVAWRDYWESSAPSSSSFVEGFKNLEVT